MNNIGLIKALSLTKKADRMSPDQRNTLQKQRLDELIAYARKNSPYFSELYKNIAENTPLSELPVTNKKMLMAKV